MIRKNNKNCIKKTTEKKVRKGQKKMSLDGETIIDMIKNVKKLAWRRDGGGSKDYNKWLQRKMKSLGHEISYDTAAAFNTIIQDQLEGGKKRSSSRLNESIKRLQGFGLDDM
jgi:hypothetical protein